jgi:MoaA/NifB/PqqE/SkfB family radical SAM enzyme
MLESIPLDPRRTIAALFLLPGCDMRCRFCASERSFDTMRPPQAELLLEALHARGYRNVVLGGGEPTLWPHGVERLAVRAKERGFLVQLNTNGVRPPPRFPRTPGIDRFILPIESTEAAVHDHLRHRSGGDHLSLVQRRVEDLIAAKREFTIATVLTALNVDAVEGIAHHLHRLRERGARLHAWHLYRFLPVGRGGRTAARELSLSDDRFLAACRTARSVGLDFPVYRRPHMLRSSSVEFFWFERGELVVGSRREVELVGS